MSVQQYIENGRLVRSYEFTLLEDKKGLWSGTQIYYCKAADFAAVKPKRGSAHPLVSWIYMEELAVTGEEGLVYKLEARYAGVKGGSGSGNDGDPGNDYESGVRLSTADSPLEQNKYYKDLSAEDAAEAYQWATNPIKDSEGKPVSPDTSGWDPLKIELYEDLQKGVTHFRDPRVEYYVRYTSDRKPGGMNSIGKIDNPPGAPAVASGRNWLLIGYPITQRGKVYEIEKVWELSGAGGWEPKYYS